MQNLEREVKDIHKLALSNNNNQIKCGRQLVELSQLVKFMSDNFDEFKKETEDKKNVIEELRSDVSSLNKKLNCITEQVDQQEQYSRQNCLSMQLLELLINGITKKSQENRCSSS